VKRLVLARQLPRDAFSALAPGAVFLGAAIVFAYVMVSEDGSALGAVAAATVPVIMAVVVAGAMRRAERFLRVKAGVARFEKLEKRAERYVAELRNCPPEGWKDMVAEQNTLIESTRAQSQSGDPEAIERAATRLEIYLRHLKRQFDGRSADELRSYLARST